MSTGFDFTLIVDLIVAGLLVATIVYAAILDRKLGALRKSKDEMESLIKDFADSTLKAEEGLAELRSHAGSSGNELQKQVEGAAKMLTDLKFLVERGETLSNQLESASATARDSLGGSGFGSTRGGGRNVVSTGQRDAGARQLRPNSDMGAGQSSAAPKVSPGMHDEDADPDVPISERLNLSSENPGAQALLKALQRMR
ncbi:DUF6468 domain-containing protein [Denitrobaculum tricleocarpae]|uniref:DUF6468 domain-containing protein n=1 Tax=Denitrobaculum tricleocarpae TaxID=2591009 RepID=A0A545T251_9PROT|nr:DUF6468 domain-containing protein [Denitrobaculum tricleocarpae]TQV71272.1 hypothetical protein FKG95_26930 [Denitrobaculum tricleocarpae]